MVGKYIFKRKIITYPPLLVKRERAVKYSKLWSEEISPNKAYLKGAKSAKPKEIRRKLKMKNILFNSS